MSFGVGALNFSTGGPLVSIIQDHFLSFDNRLFPLLELNFMKWDQFAGNPCHETEPVGKIFIIEKTFAGVG
jgi:hypothetical protein